LVLTCTGLYGFNLINLNPILINIQDVKSITCGFSTSIIQTNRNHLHIYAFDNILNNTKTQYIWDVI